MKLTQHLVKFIHVSERKGCCWNGSVFGVQWYSHGTHTFPSMHEVFLFVLVLQHLCILTSLMENLGLVGWTESGKENLEAWKQKVVQFGCNCRSGVCKVSTMLDALESHWMCSLAWGQNKEMQLPRTLAVDLLFSAAPWIANFSSLPTWCNSTP